MQVTKLNTKWADFIINLLKNCIDFTGHFENLTIKLSLKFINEILVEN